MNICYLANASSVHSQQWAKFFTQRGHEVHTISFVNNTYIHGRLHYIKPIGKYDAIRGGNYFVILNLLQIKRLVNTLQPDLLHAHYVTSYGFLGALTYYSPFVITVHGSDILLDLNRNPLFHITTGFALRQATLVNSVSPQITEKLNTLGVRQEKIIELQYGVDVNLFKPKEHKKNPSEKFKIISTRKLNPIYNLNLLIDAIPFLTKKIHNIEVCILGGGPERERLEQKVKNIGISQYVKFLGQLPNNQVVNHLRASDIYVSTSKSDGTSISLLEAMGCGIFPIVTDIPANREWVNNGVNGYLVPTDNPAILSDKIYEAFLNKDLLKTAFEINVELVREKASLYKNLGKIEGIYLNLLEKAKRKISV